MGLVRCVSWWIGLGEGKVTHVHLCASVTMRLDLSVRGPIHLFIEESTTDLQ